MKLVSSSLPASHLLLYLLENPCPCCFGFIFFARPPLLRVFPEADGVAAVVPEVAPVADERVEQAAAEKALPVPRAEAAAGPGVAPVAGERVEQGVGVQGALPVPRAEG
jgi:hypothetical protein